MLRVWEGNFRVEQAKSRSKSAMTSLLDKNMQTKLIGRKQLPQKPTDEVPSNGEPIIKLSTGHTAVAVRKSVGNCEGFKIGDMAANAWQNQLGKSRRLLRKERRNAASVQGHLALEWPAEPDRGPLGCKSLIQCSILITRGGPADQAQ